MDTPQHHLSQIGLSPSAMIRTCIWGSQKHQCAAYLFYTQLVLAWCR